ncbi:probable methyltransferase-like protein 25 isoform X2 [Clytia hemisphaerica]|uniref:probable methyltransferase-like protein 25 isoform X2 n=1 Tax=Clytia hemisphaerica TaxID=252671 RepID=UPI0034D4E6EB
MEHHNVSLETLQSDLDQLVTTITKFSTIIQSHLNDFIITEVWSNTQDAREELSKQFDDENFDNTMPCCYYYGSGKHFEKKMDLHASHPTKLDAHLPINAQRKCHRHCKKRDTAAQTNINEKNLNSFLTVKKEHEVSCLSKLLNDIADESLCRKIVDFGSGKGYLGQHMTSHNNCDVLGIEMKFGCSSSAENMKEKMKTAHRSVTYDRYKTITHTVQASDPASDDTESLVTLIKENLNSSELVEERVDYILTGLHACGDLTTSAIKTFVKEKDFRAICIVGCCYNLISEKGFPISEYGKKCGLNFGKSEKMLACQCPSRWLNTGQTLNKSLLYRAILQKIFKDLGFPDDEINQIKLRKLGKKEISFRKYMETVRKRCPLLDQRARNSRSPNFQSSIKHKFNLHLSCR